jgi:putative SOS response-associated peptidase YedK
MCGRYSQYGELSEIRIEFDVDRVDISRDFRPLYNIAPSYGPGFEQPIVVRNRSGERVLRLGRWWMIPSFWDKPLKTLPTAFNARAEELESKPFFRDAFRRRRCLVPATGWREFVPARQSKKQPYHFKLEREVFAFAGVWSTWTSPDGELVDSFAIVTTRPNATAAAIHDRMPLVMPPDLYSAWLEDDAQAASVLERAQERAADLHLEMYPADPRGNSVRFEGPEVIQKVDQVPQLAEPPSDAGRQEQLALELAPPSQAAPRRR